MVPAMQPRAALPPASDEADPIYVGDTDEAAAANLLIAVCGGCHGSTAPVESSGGIRFIGNLEKLVAAGLIVPLSSATSRVVVVMVDGTMPPPSSGFFRPTDADIKIVANYIDNPRFFPGVTPAAPPPPAAADAGVGVPVDVPRDVGAEPPVGGGADAGADAG
jgi:mono/diheme cytochrome c family protein